MTLLIHIHFPSSPPPKLDFVNSPPHKKYLVHNLYEFILVYFNIDHYLLNVKLQLFKILIMPKLSTQFIWLCTLPLFYEMFDFKFFQVPLTTCVSLTLLSLFRIQNKDQCVYYNQYNL